MFVNTCLNFINSKVFPDIHNILYNVALLTCRKCLFILDSLTKDLRNGQNTLRVNHFEKFLNSKSKLEIEENYKQQNQETKAMFISIVTGMEQEGQQPSNFRKLQQPINLELINKYLISYMNQTKNFNLPYHIESNYSQKRKFYYILASLFKVLYMDVEFPYFKIKKQQKFNWKAFMNEFGSADLSVYSNLIK